MARRCGQLVSRLWQRELRIRCRRAECAGASPPSTTCRSAPRTVSSTDLSAADPTTIRASAIWASEPMARTVTEHADTIPLLAEVFREYASRWQALRASAWRRGSARAYHFFPGGKDEMLAAVLADIDAWVRGGRLRAAARRRGTGDGPRRDVRRRRPLPPIGPPRVPGGRARARRWPRPLRRCRGVAWPAPLAGRKPSIASCEGCATAPVPLPDRSARQGEQ
jgi:hypothetical protein